MAAPQLPNEKNPAGRVLSTETKVPVEILRNMAKEHQEDANRLSFMVRFLAGHLDNRTACNGPESMHEMVYRADEWEQWASRMYDADKQSKLEQSMAPIRETILAAVRSERARQISSWGHAHNIAHTEGELSCAAAFYALPDGKYWGEARECWPLSWGKEPDEKKQSKPRLHQICVAMALLLAEAERLALDTERYGEQLPKILPELMDELINKLDTLIKGNKAE